MEDAQSSAAATPYSYYVRIIINDDLFLFGEIGGDVIPVREVGNKNIWFGGFRFLA